MLFLFVTFFLWFRYGMKWLPVIIFLYVFLFVHQCSFKCPRRRLNKPKRRQKFDVSFLAGFCQEVFSIKYISFQAWKTMSRWWYGAGDTLALLHSQQLAIQGLPSVRPSHLDQDARTLMQIWILLEIKILCVLLREQSTCVVKWGMMRSLKEDVVPLFGENVLSPLMTPATLVVQVVGIVTRWPDGGSKSVIIITMEDCFNGIWRPSTNFAKFFKNVSELVLLFLLSFRIFAVGWNDSLKLSS